MSVHELRPRGSGPTGTGNGEEPPMEARIARLEDFAKESSARLGRIEVAAADLKTDVAVIKSNHSTKADVSEASSQLRKELNDQTWKFIIATLGISSALTAAVFFIAKNVK